MRLLAALALALLAPPLPAQLLNQYLDFGPLGAATVATSDSAGNVYVVGYLDNYSNMRAYKLSPTGTVLYRFDFGGGFRDNPSAAAFDAVGDLYVAGVTSGQRNFPTMQPLFPTPSQPEVSSGFLCKIDPTGKKLLFSTLVGGALPNSVVGTSWSSGVASLALDPTGAVYLAGFSTDPYFPGTPGAFQTGGGAVAGVGDQDRPISIPAAFAMKIAPTLDRLVYSTWVCPWNNYGSWANSILVDADGVTTIISLEGLSQGVIPPSPPTYLLTPGAFGSSSYCSKAYYERCTVVTRLSANGSTLLWSAIIGDISPGVARAQYTYDQSAVLDSAGNVLLAGSASSTSPAMGAQPTPGALQTTAPSNTTPAFIGKLSADGSKFTAATYFGTAAISSLATDPQGNIWVAGATNPPALLDFPSTPPPAAAFYAELSPNLDALIQGRTLPGYALAAIAPTAPGSAITVSDLGAVDLIPSPSTSPVQILDVSNSAATAPSEAPFTLQTAWIGVDWQYVSPGSFVSIYGSGLGPAIGLGATFDSPGHIATSLGGVSVSFDGVPASLLYASSGQINAIVPFEIAGQTATVLKVQTAAGMSQSIALPVIASTPFVFGALQPGTDPYGIANFYASALNQDGSINSASNPAKSGSVVTVFANGAGIYSAPLSDGTIVGTPLQPLLPVTIYSASLNTNRTPAYAGAAPGLVAGALQVNFVLDAKPSVYEEYTLNVGSYSSQPFKLYTSQ